MKRRRLTAAPLLLALLSACGEPSLRRIEEEAWREQPSQEVLAISEADLALVGERLAARRRYAPLRADAPSVEQAIRSVACRLDPPRCPRLEVQLWRSPLPAIAAWPNGYLELTTGMLLRVADESELSALVAHALAHDRLGHRAQAVRAAQRALLPHTTRLGLLERPEPVAVGSPYLLPTYAGSSVVGYFQVIGETAAVAQAAWVLPILLPVIPIYPFFVLGQGAIARPMMIDTDLEIALLPFSAALENEAEEEAARLLAQAGFDAGAAAPLLRRLAHERLHTVEPPDWRPFHEIHPLELGQLEARASAAPPHTPIRTRRGEGWSATIAAHRLEWLVQEIGRGGPAASLGLIDALVAREPTALDLIWAQAELVRRRGETGDLEWARATLERLAREPRAPALAARSLGLVLDRLGRGDAAAAAFRHYLAQAPSAPERALLEFRLRDEAWPFTLPAAAEGSSRARPKLVVERPRWADYQHTRTSAEVDAWSLFGKGADVTVLLKGLAPGAPLAAKDSPAVELGMFSVPAPHGLPPGANPLELVDLLSTLFSAGGADLVELRAVAPDDFAEGPAVRAEWRILEHSVGIEQRVLALLRVVDGRLVGVLFRAAAFGPYPMLFPNLEASIRSARIQP